MPTPRPHRLVPLAGLSLLVFFVFQGAVSGFMSNPTPPVFRFHVFSEPADLDPAHLTASSGNYLHHNLYRSLLRYRPGVGLVPEGARSCNWQGRLRLVCYLDPERKWSDGSSITAAQYVQAFQRLVDPNTRTIQTELVLSLKNAREILAGRQPPARLGVSARTANVLTFDLEEPDSDFEYRLASSTLAPLPPKPYPENAKASEGLFNGPYRIAEWRARGRISLEPNPYYPGAATRPRVEILLVDDDMTALRLYETGHLSLLRRLPSMFIDKFRERPDFVQLSLARFDYLGFGPLFKDRQDWRQALSLSLNYDQLKELYRALGRPGCPSLPSGYFEKPVCIPYEPERARGLLRNQPLPSLQKSVIGFSKMGGDDIQRGMEWIQGQWSQSLKWNFQLDGREQGSYLQQLRAEPPPVFRKGVTLDRPTCLAALEIFAPDHRENYIRFTHPKFSKVLTELKQTTDPARRRHLCQTGIELLMNGFALIPLGEIHFSMLASPQFKGWEINELNQLDLTRLEIRTPPLPHQGPNSSSPSDAPIRSHRPSKE